MLERFFPDLILNDIGELDAAVLYQRGFRLMIFDIDNTLVAYHEKDVTQRARRVIRSLQEQGIAVALVSNNDQERVDRFNRDMKLFRVYCAAKPLRFGFRKAMRYHDVTPEETVLCGDQILTDIFGGNRAGVYTILVSPIEAKESRFFRLKRRIEAYILKKMKEREQNTYE